MTPADILDFWFSDEAVPLHFRVMPEFDAAVSRRFCSLHERAAKGRLASWTATSQGALGLIILLDQFSRNMFRQTPRAFATDAQACEISRKAIKAGFDKLLLRDHAVFMYMPFMHSEDLSTQEVSVDLYTGLGVAESLRFAKAHRDIIARFGRFPHRNNILNRESTVSEAEFLRQPNSSF